MPGRAGGTCDDEVGKNNCQETHTLSPHQTLGAVGAPTCKRDGPRDQGSFEGNLRFQKKRTAEGIGKAPLNLSSVKDHKGSTGQAGSSGQNTHCCGGQAERSHGNCPCHVTGGGVGVG
eukprot:2757908-Amphidinium_carterae.1